jgi:formylglycine-generating enzyme required for sulfatase activity
MFTMGSDAGPPSSRPAHQVYLSEFEIAGTEVTNGQYLEYVHASGDEPLVWRQGVPALDPRQAVTGILWNEADAFCQWYGWRLPTEAEWEKAARGTDQRTFPWGDNWDPAKANTVESGNGDVVQVASYPEGRSPYGLSDMTGNAQEWVADYFDPTYYLQSPLRDPAGTEQVLDHGLRGGSWAAPLDQATTFFRDSSHSVRPNARVGFRCAADPRDS